MTPNFWKFFSNKNGTIRKAVYELVKGGSSSLLSLLTTTPSLSKDVLGLFGEKDPLTYPSLWNALLSFITAFPAAWDNVDARKHVFPRLYAFLRAGVYGTYLVSYPSLLPFISLIPRSLSTVPFFRDFFASLWKGLSSDTLTHVSTATAQPRTSTQKGKQPGSCLVDAYFECLSFAWGRSM